MRTILSILLLSSLAMGCDVPERKPLKKPFVIIGKGNYIGENNYLYQDGNGQREVFQDNSLKYSIGDTIK